MIYSDEHPEQVAGIAFIDSSHYNQINYFGKEFREISDKQIEELLSSFWLIELASKLGIFSMMGVFDTSGFEDHEEVHKTATSFDRWNPPYSTIKSMVSNLNLAFEQGKEVHYHRGDLPIISISASEKSVGGQLPTGFTEQEAIDSWKLFHKDLSNNGRYVVVNGTNHMSIVENEETAEHILSLIPLIGEKQENE